MVPTLSTAVSLPWSSCPLQVPGAKEQIFNTMMCTLCTTKVGLIRHCIIKYNPSLHQNAILVLHFCHFPGFPGFPGRRGTEAWEPYKYIFYVPEIRVPENQLLGIEFSNISGIKVYSATGNVKLV